jgi:hypothetical protein
MKLSENTVTTLKNFASINQGLVIYPGNKLRTISSSKAILAEADIDETFKFEFGIYDLNKLLGVLTMTKGDQPEVKLEKEFISFTGLGGKAASRIRFTASNLILKPPTNSIKATYEIKFDLTAEILDWVFNVASVLKCPNVVVKGDGKEVSLWAMDVKGEIVDDANVTVGKTDREFSAALKIENLKLIAGAYTVEISSKGVSKFTSTNNKLTYWIALEQGHSKF